jgi:GGDEF domain-containing protein
VDAEQAMTDARRTYPNPRVDTFVRDAAARVPGTLYGFNIADFKRRNSHVGHTVGDEDVREIDRMLHALPDAFVARTAGDHWLVLMGPSAGSLAAIVALLDAFARHERVTMGWEVRSKKDGAQKSLRDVIDAELHRAVRCLYADVGTPAELADAATRIENESWSLPVNRPIALSELATIERKRWQCVSRYPEKAPACAFCEQRDIDFHDGDGAIYSGDGTCRKCGASISISDAFERV